jgi:hypothetical protein
MKMKYKDNKRLKPDGALPPKASLATINKAKDAVELTEPRETGDVANKIRNAAGKIKDIVQHLRSRNVLCVLSDHKCGEGGKITIYDYISELAGLACENGLHEQAKELAAIAKNNIDWNMKSLIVDLLARIGLSEAEHQKPLDSDKTMEEAMELAKKIEELGYDTELQKSLGIEQLKAYIASGRTELAKPAIVEGKYSTANSWLDGWLEKEHGLILKVALKEIELGKTKEWKETVALLISDVEKSESGFYYPTWDRYIREIVAAVAERADVEDAKWLCEELIKHWPTSATEDLVSKIVETVAERGDADGAKWLCERVLEARYVGGGARGIASVSKLLAKNGRGDEALRWIETNRPAPSLTPSYSSNRVQGEYNTAVAGALLVMGHEESALSRNESAAKRYALAKETYLKNSDYYDKIEGDYRILLCGLYSVAMAQIGSGLLGDARETALVLSEHEPAIATNIRLVDVQCNGEDQYSYGLKVEGYVKERTTRVMDAINAAVKAAVDAIER